MLPARGRAVVSKALQVQFCSASPDSEIYTRRFVDFDSPQEATAGKSNYELFRGWLVFNLLKNSHLVDNSLKYFELSKKYLGLSATERLLKATIFGQFVGGLNEGECRRVVRRLADAGVSSIWNYSTERDLDNVDEVRTEACLAEQEKGFQEVTDKYLKSIKTSADCNGGRGLRLAAVKFTPIVNPQLVMKLNQMLVTSQSVFDQLASKDTLITDRTISKHSLRKEFPGLLERGCLEADRGSAGVSAVQWNKHFSVARNINRFQLLIEKANVSPDSLTLSSLEMKQIDGFLDKLDSIGECARDHGVSVLVDAEQTYFQQLFDHLVLHHLTPSYNSDGVVIYNTLQAYLKSSMEKLLMSLATAASYGVHCGIKLVRGAYMEQERQLARSKGHSEPIHPTKQATDANYNTCLSHLLESVPNLDLSVIVASHNQDSVQLAIDKMNELKLSKTDGRVAFGQLLGMGDHLTYPLASAGYLANKVIAYGTLDDVVPFLSRRAQENRSLMVNADRERKIYELELKRRWFSGN